MPLNNKFFYIIGLPSNFYSWICSFFYIFFNRLYKLKP